MSNKLTYGIIAAIVILAVAVISLFLRAPQRIVERFVGSTNSSTIGIGGDPTGVTELSFANGEVERFGKRELKMESGAATEIFDNRSGDDLLIDNLRLVIPTDASGSAATFVLVWATTTTSNTTLGNDSGFALNGNIGHWVIATGTKATTTSMAQLARVGKPLGVPAAAIGYGTASYEHPIILKNNERLIFQLISASHITSGSVALTGTQVSTSTSRGFDPIVKFDYESVD